MKPFYLAKTAFATQNVLSVFFYLLITLCITALNAQDVLMGLTANGGPEGKGTAFSIKTDTKSFNVIKSFVDWGSKPESELVRGTDGYLYGMTPNGGTYGHGTLFRISTGGDITILKHFDYYAEGGYPHGSLIQATDGNFYGLLNSSNNYSGGAVFKMTPGGKFSLVRGLSLGTDGGRPNGRLLQASDGAFYGINTSGGTYGYGTIFKLTLGGSYSVLKSFNGTTEGANSYGSLVQASDGALYGMTKYGGNNKVGVIFRIETGGAFKVLKHLNGSTDAAYPTGDLVQGKDGWLYGMAPTGVSYNGLAFKINMSGTSFFVLHKMITGVDGGNPTGSLIQGKDGYFYGLNSLAGGSGYSGTAFKMASNGELTVLKRFTEATEGGWPYGSLIQAPDGTLFGMTFQGGKNTKGTIFKLSGSTNTTSTILIHLNGSNLGSEPWGNLAIGKDSAYFGVTKTGGAYNHGTLFKICGGVTTILKSFNRSVDGEYPVGGLLRGKDGNLYGMTEYGGSYGGGTIYRYTTTGSFSVLRHMNPSTDGKQPQGTLVQGADGLLYGVTYSGGSTGYGTIFKIGTSGGSTFKVLRSLVYATDGDRLLGGLTIGKDRAFYGMTSNSTRFFRIDSIGNFIVKKTMSYSTDGGTPYGSLILGTDGHFYGTMSSGGTYYGGLIFRITHDGLYTKLKQLNPATEGGGPKGSLVQGSDGAIYGTTSTGGTGKAGSIFKLSGTGFTTFTVLRHLNMATDGGTPLGGLIVAPKVTLVATPQSGLTTREDTAKAITLSGSGATTLTYNVLIKPRHGSVSSGTGAARIYTPATHFNGVDSFAFTTNLGCLSSAPAWVKINVSSVNDAPVIAAISNKTVVKGNLLKFLITATDVDAGQTKTFSLVTPPTGATITTAGTFSWTPSVTGTFTIKVRVTDNGSPVLYSEKTFTVTVTAPAVATATIVAAESELSAIKKQEDKTTAAASLYPNPATSRFTIALAAPSTSVLVRVFDSKGSLISAQSFKPQGSKQIDVDATYLRRGLYFVEITTEESRETLQLIKQ